MIKVIFIGTSQFSVQCLRDILDTQDFKVPAVITVSDRCKNRGLNKQASAVKIFAQDNNIPVFMPEDLAEPVFLKQISNLNPEFAILCDYGKILPKIFLNLFAKPSVNIHPSLLPRWRGAAPIERALMNGDKKTGVCLQFLSEKLDAGDIISQVSFDVEQDHNAEDLYKKAQQISKKLLQEDLPLYLKGKLKPQSQDDSQKTYAKKIDKKESQIDWQDCALNIHNKVRSLVLGPQAFSFFYSNNGKKQRLKIYKTKLVEAPGANGISQDGRINNLPGKILILNEKELVLTCGKQGHQALSLLEVQRESRKKQNISEFLKGACLKPSDHFGL